MPAPTLARLVVMVVLLAGAVRSGSAQTIESADPATVVLEPGSAPVTVALQGEELLRLERLRATRSGREVPGFTAAFREDGTESHRSITLWASTLSHAGGGVVRLVALTEDGREVPVPLVLRLVSRGRALARPPPPSPPRPTGDVSREPESERRHPK